MSGRIEQYKRVILSKHAYMLHIIYTEIYKEPKKKLK
jgi:hypothetical protein